MVRLHAVSLISLLLGISLARTITADPAQAPVGEASGNELFITVGKSVVVNSDSPIQRVAVGFGDIAQANAVTPREVLVSGKAPGSTSLIVWQEGGNKLIFDVIVRPNNTLAEARLNNVRREIKRELPGRDINLSFENETVFLRGRAGNLTGADRAVAIASTLGKTVNLLYVDVPPTEQQILLRRRK